MKKVLIVILAATILYAAFKILVYEKSYTTDSQLSLTLKNEFDKGDLDGLIKKANEAIAKDDKNISALIGLATAYAMKGSVGYSEKENGSKAVDYSDKIIALDPGNSEAYRIKAYAFEIQEQYPLAYQNYEKAVELNPNNYQAWSNMGHAYDLQGDWEKASQYYLKSLAVNPNGEHALLNIARLLIRQKDYERAKIYLQALASTTNSSRFKAEGFQVLAELHRIKAEYPEAIQAIENSISNDPNIPQAWVTRGRLELRNLLGVTEPEKKSEVLKSVEEYANKAIAINNNQASAYQLLSDLMIMTGDSAKSQDYKDKALKVVDSDITLGEKEKAAMKAYLTVKIKVVN